MKNLRARAQRRLINREGAKVQQEMTKVIRGFEKALFAETPSQVTYETLFKKFNHQWIAACDALSPKLKAVAPDKEYFYNNFKPQV